MVDASVLNEPVKDLVETPYIKFWREGDILCGAYTDGLHIDLPMAIQIVADRINYSHHTDSYCYADIRGIRSVTKEARQHMADEGSRYVIAGAMLVESLLSKTIGNIYLTVSRPPVPIRLFTDKAEAMKWLRQKQLEAGK